MERGKFGLSDYFSRFHIVDYEEGCLRVGFRRAESDYFLAGIFQKEVSLVKQLHFPQTQRSEMIKVLMEFAHVKR